jgi:hypothetical protein
LGQRASVNSAAPRKPVDNSMHEEESKSGEESEEIQNYLMINE